MSVSDFSALCDWSSEIATIKLLGGEPLLHSNLTDILDVAIKKQKKVTFVSNISVEPSIFDCFAEYCKCQNFLKLILINTDYPDSQEEIFIRNLKKLCATKTHLSFSTTLLPSHKSICESLDRIKQLVEIYCSIRGSVSGFHVRLAPFCPNPTYRNKYELYNFTDDVTEFLNELFLYGVNDFSFDCPINLCELDTKFIDRCRDVGIKIRTGQCGPEKGMPFDVLVDNRVIWCSSSPFLQLDNWKKYRNIEEARRALSALYYSWQRYNGVCDHCKSCNKYNPGLCSGFCISKTNALNNIPIISQVNNSFR